VVEGGWLGLSAPEERRAGPAARARPVMEEFAHLRQHGLRHVSRPHHGRDRGAARAWLGGAEGAYLPKLVEGVWTGTMNLTEPHCGTDLGLIKTRPCRRRRQLRDHRHQDLHLRRRARPDREHRPPGAGQAAGRARGHEGHLAVRGAEVPVKADGSLGERNGVSCGSIEHKMGIHGNATCVMNYDGANRAGWSASRERAWRHVHMMNEARLGVGMQGLAVSEVAYQNALAYARPPAGPLAHRAEEPRRPADPIIVHPTCAAC
jgi:acyl-CoA dehydrogenase